MVNIIIPAYNAHNTIRQAVASVAVQDNQEEIKLTIVDDCSKEKYDYLLEEFKFLDINILYKPFNSGSGQTRQYGVDRSNCEYIMFLDADDCLYSNSSVKKLLSIIKDKDYDVVSSIFLEESESDDDYIVHQNDLVWMHGKIYRTQYIKKHNIQFNQTRMNEDSAYNMIIYNSNAKIFFTDLITYIWKNNRQSITRIGDYMSESINDFIINAKYAILESIRLNSSKEKIRDCVVQYLISLYGYYLIFLNEKRNKIFIDSFILNMKEFIKSIPDYYKKAITKENIEKIFYHNTVINILISSNIIITLSIYEFIDIIK